MSKEMRVVLICAVVVMVFAGMAEGGNIKDGVMQSNTNPGCGPKRNPANCQLPEANTYSRGCEAGERCRQSRKLSEIQIPLPNWVRILRSSTVRLGRDRCWTAKTNKESVHYLLFLLCIYNMPFCLSQDNLFLCWDLKIEYM